MDVTAQRGEHESAKSYVLRVLIDNIINTRLAPGEKLNEPELCEKLGVSRTPFREAELELAQRRLIEIRPKIGNYGESFEANLGPKTPLGLSRGLNRLWTKGGILISPPDSGR